MLFKRGGRGDGSYLQNRFTAYLVTSVRRKKNEIIKARMKRQEHEGCMDIEEYFYALSVSDLPLENLVCEVPGSFKDVYFENEKLEHALRKLSERDRYVLFAKAMAERSFEELAAELGISYKGIAAAYSRAIKKLKKELEEDNE